MKEGTCSDKIQVSMIEVQVRGWVERGQCIRQVLQPQLKEWSLWNVLLQGNSFFKSRWKVAMLHGMIVCGPCIPLPPPFTHPSPPIVSPPLSPSLPFTHPSPPPIHPPLSPSHSPTPLPPPIHPPLSPYHSHIEESAAPALLDLSLPPTPSAETQNGTT